MYIAFLSGTSPYILWSLSSETLKHSLNYSESESTEVYKDWFISIYDVCGLYHSVTSLLNQCKVCTDTQILFGPSLTQRIFLLLAFIVFSYII